MKGTLNKIVVKDNNSERYAIFDRYSNQPLELKYDLVIPGLDINQKSYNGDKYFIVKKDSKYALYSADYNKESSYYDLIEQRTFYNHYGSFVPYIVAKNKGKMGMILFDSRKKEFREYIPFRFDNIIDRNIVTNNKLYGVYDVEKNTLKIPPIYKTKPEILKIISYYGRKYKIYQAVNKNNIQVSILSNGVELYRNK